jgi:hypothetical protein
MSLFLLLACCAAAACQASAVGSLTLRDLAEASPEPAIGFGDDSNAPQQLAASERGRAPRFDPGAWDGAAAEGKDAKLAESSQANIQVEAAERMRIYQGTITVEVARRDDAQTQFLAKVKEWGGYLSQQEDDQLTVRVPAARFDEAFAWLHSLGRVRSESKQASDVTDQYLDLGIRLENAKKSRERLLALLAKAEKVEDILKIEEQMRRLTEEIERFEGQMKRLQDQVALATITARFVTPAAAPDRPGGRPSRFAWIRAIGAERLLEGGF